MPHKADLLIIFGLGFIFIVMISVPYFWAFQNSGSDYVFGGFLINPIDGNSYLAKMYQGWQGNWKFNLPYSPQFSSGGYLFMFYLSLGHFSRTLGTSLQFTFHFARILGAVVLVFSLWNFFNKALSTRRATLFAFGLALFGSGMGWLAAFFGAFTADFWVAEGYPFLSAYANPHFPIGMALMLCMLTPAEEEFHSRQNTPDLFQTLILFVAAFVLGIVLPFGVVLVIIVLAGIFLWDIWIGLSSYERKSSRINWLIEIFRQSDSLQKLLAVILGGMPVLFYDVWITQADPLLAIWNEQNLTISPLLWDTFISFSPLILVAIPGIYWVVREKNMSARVLLIWVALGFLLMYFPWNLQRRFTLGYMIPLAGLAALGLDHIFNRSRVFGLVAACLIVLLMLPTNLMIILGGVQAVQEKEPRILLTRDEHNSLVWLESNLPKDALVLASPEMGLLIPAHTGRRVLYGHPYETVNAQQMEELVLNLFRDLNEDDILLADVSYIFYGEREQDLAEEEFNLDYDLKFSSGDVRILKVQD